MQASIPNVIRTVMAAVIPAISAAPQSRRRHGGRSVSAFTRVALPAFAFTYGYVYFFGTSERAARA